VVKPGKRYETEVQEPFRVTKACLELASVGEKGKVSSLMIECDNNEEFIIANLSGKVFNETLDLAFNEGEKICFKVDGPGTVHLTGNLMDDPNDGSDGPFDMMNSDSEASEESETEEAIREVVESKSKRKNEAINQITSAAKKSKIAAMEESEEDSDEDDDSEEEDEITDADTTANGTIGDSDGDDESDSEDDSDDGEETIPEKAIPEKEVAGATPKPSKKKDVEVKKIAKETKVKEAEAETPKVADKTPKSPKSEAKVLQAKVKTPKAEAKTPKVEAMTPKAEAKTPKAEAKTPKADEIKAVPTPGKTPKRSLKGGVQMEDLKEGTGQEAKTGSLVGMFYAGKLKTNNKQFDACQEGKPFKFKLGAGEVIKGWDVGVVGMKVGGKRRLTVPAAMAYGKEGSPPVIPPHSVLVFDVECKFVK
jgi:FK506-binding nuclear protein